MRVTAPVFELLTLNARRFVVTHEPAEVGEFLTLSNGARQIHLTVTDVLPIGEVWVCSVRPLHNAENLRRLAATRGLPK